MTQYTYNAYTTETPNQYVAQRQEELDDQHWNRESSRQLAESEGIHLNNDHWALITYLRTRYVDVGLPRHARYLSNELASRYAPLGGNKYLRHLFPGGPVTQGCRLANLRTPPDATDRAFGHSY